MSTVMKLQVFCTTSDGIRSGQFIMNCSQDCTLKWLSLAAAARFAQQGAFSHVHNQPLSPIEIFKGHGISKDASFLHPMSALKTYFKEKDKVTVLLATETKLGEFGRPERSNWAILAFDVSESQRQRRADVELEIFELERDRDRRLSLTRQSKHEAKIYSMASEMRETIKSKLDDEDALSSAFYEDWIVLNRLKAFVDICGGPVQRHEVEGVLRINYPSLCELFKIYSASGPNGSGTYSTKSEEMELSEFSEFFYDSSAFKVQSHIPDLIQQIFKTCHDEFVGHSSKIVHLNGASLKRPNFMASVLIMAWLKYIDGGKGDGVISRKIPRGAVDHSADQPSTNVSPSFEKLMHDYVDPLIAKNGVGFIARSALRDTNVLAFLQSISIELKSKFESYSSLGADLEHSKGVRVYEMTFSDFSSLIESARLLGQNGGACQGELTLSEVRQAFAGAQGELEDKYDLKASATKTDGNDQVDSKISHFLRMDFAEYIDALIRVALLKYENMIMPVLEKVQRTCGAIVKALPA